MIFHDVKLHVQCTLWWHCKWREWYPLLVNPKDELGKDHCLTVFSRVKSMCLWNKTASRQKSSNWGHWGLWDTRMDKALKYIGVFYTPWASACFFPFLFDEQWKFCPFYQNYSNSQDFGKFLLKLLFTLWEAKKHMLRCIEDIENALVVRQISME